MVRLRAIVATMVVAAVLGACTSGESEDEAPEPEAEPGSSIGVLPEEQTAAPYRRIPLVVRRQVEDGGSRGRGPALCEGPDGTPEEVVGRDLRDQADDGYVVGDLDVTRQLTLHRDTRSAEDWVRDLRRSSSCTRVDGRVPSSFQYTGLTRDPRAPRKLPREALVGWNLLGVGADGDPVLVLDLVIRRDNAVSWVRVVDLDARQQDGLFTDDTSGTGPVTRTVDAEARRAVRALDGLRAADGGPTDPATSGPSPAHAEPDSATDAIPDGVLAQFRASSGYLCTGPQGLARPPSPAERGRVSDLTFTDGNTVTRELTVHPGAAAARTWVRRLGDEGPCVRVDGQYVHSARTTPLRPDPRSPRVLPDGTLVRTQLLRTSGATDPVLLVDLVRRRGAAVLWSQVMDVAAPAGSADVPLADPATREITRRIDQVARDGARLLARLGPGRD